MKHKSLQVKFAIDGELIRLMRNTITDPVDAEKAVRDEFEPYIELAIRAIFPEMKTVPITSTPSACS